MDPYGSGIPHKNEDSQLLSSLLYAAKKSAFAVHENLSTLSGRMSVWYSGLFEEMPEWALNHIVIHKQLEKLVLKIKDEAEVPDSIYIVLNSSRDVLSEIANTVNAFAYRNAIIPESQTVDAHKLLIAGGSIPLRHEEWHLNLGLLMNVYHKTKNPDLKKQIEFLALNYLAKAAPINFSKMNIDQSTKETITNLFQYGLINPARVYHRENSLFESIIEKYVHNDFSLLNGKFWLTDTTEFESLLPSFFNVLDTLNVEEIESFRVSCANGFAKCIKAQFLKNQDQPFSQFLSSPFLLDLTVYLKDCIRAGDDPVKIKEYQDKIKEIEVIFETALDDAIKLIPDLIQTEDDKQKLKIYLKANCICISRNELKEIGILQLINIFNDPPTLFKEETHFLLNHFNQSHSSDLIKSIIADLKIGKSKGELENFVNLTGIRLGGVSSRVKIFNFIELPELVNTLRTGRQMTEYAVQGDNVIAFKDKESILKSALFTRFQKNMQSSQVNPAVAILGQATTALIDGLLTDIPKDKWDRINRDPGIRALLQISLFRLMQHLANADKSIDNFAVFSQFIELVHSELATIISLTTPYPEDEFTRIYHQNLQKSGMIPKELLPHVQVGVGKSAMNVFAGVDAALALNSPALRTFGDGSYFELISFIGDNLPISKAESADLYVGEFNHNINNTMHQTHYSAGTIIEDIERLQFKKRPLTVAIDCTIDFFNSPRVKEVLEHFKQDIIAGSLNFVFFRSGQKFDMLGMDNYYGAPFWIVNNGGGTWSEFAKISQSDTHKTDPISMQWFTLVNKHAPEWIENYKRQIFTNTRAILNSLPEPVQNDNFQICTVDSKMSPSFIHIKIYGDKPLQLINFLEGELFKRFVKAGSKIHSRGSFGFYHPNWNVLLNKEDNLARHIRINPGLDPNDNQIIIDFLKDLKLLCKSRP